MKLEQLSQAQLRRPMLPDRTAAVVIERVATAPGRATPPLHRAQVILEPQRPPQAIRRLRKPAMPVAPHVSELNAHETLRAAKLLRVLLVLQGRLGRAKERPEELGAAPIEQIVPTLSKIV